MAKPLPLEVKDLSCLFGKMGMADSQAAERKERSEVVVRRSPRSEGCRPRPRSGPLFA